MKKLNCRTASNIFKILFLQILLGTSFLHAEIFRFKYNTDESYKILSVVDENVYKNKIFSHNAQIVNRITVKISSVTKDEKTGIESALFNCIFMTSEQNSNKSFAWGREYPSIFKRNSLGKYEISSEYFMPVVRDVPIFPESDVKKGGSWTAEGAEAHDFRTAFGIEKPFTVPFTVNYTYEGDEEKNGKIYNVINAEYTMNYQVPDNLLKKFSRGKKGAVFPVKTKGISSQKLYWDNELGNLVSYTEEFKITLTLNTGERLDYAGTAHAQVIYLETEKKENTEKGIKREIEKLGLENTEVKKTEKGLTISIEKIQFEPDSAILHESEKEKLKIIGEILKNYPDTELLVTGHTALAGTETARQELSEARAEAVAGFLISLGVRTPEYIFTRGMGARLPISPNTSEENKARNRRVEITILE